MSEFNFGFFCGIGTAIAIIGLTVLIYLACDFFARWKVSREGERKC